MDNVAQRLIVVGGLPGVGKSTLAEAVAKAMPFCVALHSDDFRRRVYGLEFPLEPGQPLPQGAYSADLSTKTFDLLHEAVFVGLRYGFSVIVAATSINPKDRKAYWDIARECGVEHYFVWCFCDESIVKERLAVRPKSCQESYFSDAGYDIYCRMNRPGIPNETNEEKKFLVPVNTGGPLSYCVKWVLEATGVVN